MVFLCVLCVCVCCVCGEHGLCVCVCVRRLCVACVVCLWCVCVADWYRAVVTREPGEVGKVRPAERAQEERELEDLSRLGAGQGGWVSGSLTA